MRNYSDCTNEELVSMIAEGDEPAGPEPQEEQAIDTAAENADDETTISISLPDDLTDEQF